MSDILERLTRKETALRVEFAGLLNRTLTGDECDAIHRHTMLVAREAWADGCRHLPSGRPMYRGYTEGEGADVIARTVRERFPLPPKRVLREERVKDEDGIPTDPYLFRVAVEVLGEIFWCDTRKSYADGRAFMWLPLTHSEAPAPTAGRIRLWADLLANPYREEPQ